MVAGSPKNALNRTHPALFNLLITKLLPSALIGGYLPPLLVLQNKLGIIFETEAEFQTNL